MENVNLDGSVGKVLQSETATELNKPRSCIHDDVKRHRVKEYTVVNNWVAPDWRKENW